LKILPTTLLVLPITLLMLGGLGLYGIPKNYQ